MKNLFDINENEKKRILEMHENASKKQYLKETISSTTKGFKGTTFSLENFGNTNKKFIFRNKKNVTMPLVITDYKVVKKPNGNVAIVNASTSDNSVSLKLEILKTKVLKSTPTINTKNLNDHQGFGSELIPTFKLETYLKNPKGFDGVPMIKTIQNTL